MAWKLNEPGATLNQADFTLNGGSLISVVKRYYTGAIALGMQLLRRGIGF